jgi:adenine deaminase
MVTINPAKQLGIDNRVGSIEVGKDGDVVIYDQHPLSNFTKVEKVFIDGQLYFDRTKDLEDRPNKEREKKALITKAAEEQKKNGPQGGGRRGGL